MRLIECERQGNFSQVDYDDNNIPRYAILSHSWGADGEEVTFKDLTEDGGKNKAGYKKILFCKTSCQRWSTAFLGGHLLRLGTSP